MKVIFILCQKCFFFNSHDYEFFRKYFHHDISSSEASYNSWILQFLDINSIFVSFFHILTHETKTIVIFNLFVLLFGKINMYISREGCAHPAFNILSWTNDWLMNKSKKWIQRFKKNVSLKQYIYCQVVFSFEFFFSKKKIIVHSQPPHAVPLRGSAKPTSEPCRPSSGLQNKTALVSVLQNSVGNPNSILHIFFLFLVFFISIFQNFNFPNIVKII